MKIFLFLKKVLKDVVKDTKSASEKILNLTDNINFNISEIKDNISLLKELLKNDELNKALGLVDRLVDKAIEGQDIAFDMISALEFQDITKQKIDKLLKVVKDLEKKLSDLIIKFGLKHNKIDVDTLNRLGEKDSILNDQDLVNQLLKEFGL